MSKLSPWTHDWPGSSWEFAHRFSERITRLLWKNERMSDFLKKWVIHSFAHFWWVTWAIPSHRSFLVGDLSNLLTSLIKKEGMSELLIKKKTYKKHTKNKILTVFSQPILSKSPIRSFIMSDLSKLLFAHGGSFVVSDLRDLLTDAHLSWAIWANRSQLLICLQRPEWFAHSCSFVLSDLSESLTAADLIWAK